MTLSALRAEKGYRTDKQEAYLSLYETVFQGLKVLNLLELGALEGESLKLWRDYFSTATVWGIDERPLQELGDRIVWLRHTISTLEGFRAFCSSSLPSQIHFDVIIDDASHIASHVALAYNVLFNDFLRPGGLYCIEDWGVGYWQDWPESASGAIRRPFGRAEGCIYPGHQGGMAGIVKQLVDECHWRDQTGVKQLSIIPGLVIVQKL